MDFGKQGKQMGGFGSGRIKSRERDLIQHCDSLDVSIIYRWGEVLFPVYAFIEQKDGKAYLCIDYRISWMGPRMNYTDRFELEYTHPGFGGKRYWIVCNQCGKRVGKLYRPNSEYYFRCRICHDLMYISQESNIYDGLLKKISRVKGMSPKKYEKMALVGLHCQL